MLCVLLDFLQKVTPCKYQLKSVVIIIIIIIIIIGGGGDADLFYHNLFI